MEAACKISKLKRYVYSNLAYTQTLEGGDD